jgi:PAP2 superfamily/Vanadium chloroperoxidase N-terminal domain
MRDIDKRSEPIGDFIKRVRKLAAPLVACACLASSACADVIADWDEKGVAVVTPRLSPAATERAMAMVHVAMFDAVNSIERRYRPYLVQMQAAKTTSKEASAAAAAAAVLAGLFPDVAAEMKATLGSYLATVPESESKSDAIKLGEAVAARVLEARSKDGSTAPDDYRPRTSPGVYVPTQPVVLPMWPRVTPFVMDSGSQFRPGPPIALKSEQWAKDYNEIKDYGGSTSAKRSPAQTEQGRFWFITGAQAVHPLARQLAASREMSVIDCARFMALVSMAANDAYIAVLDAKFHYEFWRPITAIRNGDKDDNPSTERDAAWQPLGATPMHPEYPCAHCIGSATFAAVAESVLGTADVGEFSMTSPTAPGATHRWTNLWAYANEVAEARIWAGFHYRFSTRVGQDMGRRIGRYVVQNVMQRAN